MLVLCFCKIRQSYTILLLIVLVKSGNKYLLILSSASAAAAVITEQWQAVVSGIQEQEQLSTLQEFEILLPLVVHVLRFRILCPNPFNLSCTYKTPHYQACDTFLELHLALCIHLIHE